MTSPAFEAFLARLYVDDALRQQFVDDPVATARAARLTDTECESLGSVDLVGLRMAAESFARKRKLKATSAHSSLVARLLKKLAR